MKNKTIRVKKDYYGFIKEMTDKQAGEFIKAVCERVYEGKPFVTKDCYLKGVFAFVERDLQVSAQNRLNGKKGAEILAERKRKAQSVGGLEILLGSLALNADDTLKSEKK